MIATLDPTGWAVLALGVGVAAALAGVLAGLLGVGGGIVIVPVLFWVFTLLALDPGIAMQVAVASSLATIVATSISSARAHHSRGAVDVALLRSWWPWLASGALVGGLLAGGVDGTLLLWVFGLVGLAVAVNLAVPGQRVLAPDLPQTAGAQPAMATLIGAVSAMMGIGGGTLGVPTLTAFSQPVHRAVGTAAAFGLVIAAPAVVAYVAAGWGDPALPPLSLGYVNLAAVAVILPISTLLAPLGARLAHALDARRVKQAFAVFLALTAMRMLATALG